MNRSKAPFSPIGKLLPLLVLSVVTSSVSVMVRAQDAEQQNFGHARTTRLTTLRATPAGDGAPLRALLANETLRWVEGERRDGFLRVIQERGPVGWVNEADLAAIEPPLLVAVAEAATACATTLSACPTHGCATDGTPHALLNRQKRRAPLAGAAPLLTFPDFKHLQQQSDALVGQAHELDATQRAQLSALQTTAGPVSEGATVQVAGFIATGPAVPHANLGGESVNCQLSGVGNNDFHISIVPATNGTEFTGIVVEMIPQNRIAAWNLAKLKKAQQQRRPVLVTGALFYDNAHTVNNDPQSTSTQPKRFSLWEIHRISDFRVCLKAGGGCDPAQVSQWNPLSAL